MVNDQVDDSGYLRQAFANVLVSYISQLELFFGCHLQNNISFTLDISSCIIAHIQLLSIVNRSERVKHTLISTYMMGCNKYFITFIDDCTKYCYVYLLKSKDEAIDKYVLYKNEVENQLGKKIKVVRSDKGGEYVSPFAEICAQHGIRHEFTTPYSPQQNGIAERKNRTLKEMVAFAGVKLVTGDTNLKTIAIRIL
ncbi:pol polyprotein [Tanacetum coccineum]